MAKIEVEKIALRSGHKGAVYTLQMFQNEGISQFLSASGDGMVVSWPVDYGIRHQAMADLEFSTKRSQQTEPSAVAQLAVHIFAVQMLPKQKFALGGLKGGIRILDLNTNKEIEVLGEESISVFDLQILEDYLLAARGDGTLLIRANSAPYTTKIIKVAEASLRNLAIEPVLLKTGKGRIAASCSDGNIYQIDWESKKVVQILSGHSRAVFASDWSPDGKYLVSGAMDAFLKIWSKDDDLSLEHSIPAHTLTINALVFDPDGKWMATASRDRSVKIWSLPDFELKKVLARPKYEGHAYSVNCLCWDAKNEVLWSGSDDKEIMGWKISCS
ncbi:MAG: centriolar protein POC1 [Limisphaerales bacterium]|jgi:centriolar protein POC1